MEEGKLQSFRTCGRGSGGVPSHRDQKNPFSLRTGHQDEWRTSASIPTKLETQLNVGPKEALAFGANTQRFYDPHVENRRETPGPGAYGNSKAFHEEVTQNVSQGAKGTGSFASKARRMPVGGYGSHPGPGAYHPPKLPSSSEAGSKRSAAFVVPSSFNPQNVFPRVTPGPGHYENKRASSAKGSRVRSCVSAFNGADDRDLDAQRLVLSARTPGPGAYEKDDKMMPLSARSAPSSSRTTRSCSASFRGPSEQRMVSVHPGLPVDPNRVAKAADTLKDFLKPVGGIKKDTPGPGHYSQDMEDVRQQEFQCYSTLGSASFQKGTQEKPRKWRPTNPGPGEYNTEVTSSVPAANSVFCSNVERIKDPAAEAPGPAFYKPSNKPKAESFHLNIRRKWV